MRILLNVLLFLAPVVLSAQLTPKMMEGPRGSIGFYQYLPPDYTSQGEKKPLIIFLHGIGEKGTGSPKDLEKIVCCGIPSYIVKGHKMQFTWNGKTEGFVLLAPQLYSRYGTWENYFIDAMFKFAFANLNIDTNRIFITGMSLGGGGTWVYASSSLTNARKLAGIAPAVSPCFMGNGCNIANANLPVYAIHAVDDYIAKYSCTENAVKSIIDCGARAVPNIVKYDDGGHYVWIRRAYDTEYKYFNPNIYEWMLAQNRIFEPNIKPVANAGKDITISSTPGTIILDGSASTDADGKIVRHTWRKISGPPYGILTAASTAHPVAKGLTFPGVYTFELRAIDDRAEWSIDSVKITVVDGNVIN